MAAMGVMLRLILLLVRIIAADAVVALIRKA